MTLYRAVAIHSPLPVERARWGERMMAAGDLDGDGVCDLLMGVPRADHLFAVSGRALAEGRLEVLYSVQAPEGFARTGFGFALTNLGDVDGDGVPDAAVGSQSGERVWVASGATGRLLQELNLPPAAAPGAHGAGAAPHFGARLGNAGDLDGDGLCEVLVGAPGASGGEGQAFIMNAASGGLVRALRLPAADRAAGPTAAFGGSLQGPGDVDGDGVPDQLVSAPHWNGDRGRMYLFSGSTGECLLSIDSPEPRPGAIFGFQDVAPMSPGDVGATGYADIYGNGFRQSGASGSDEGRAWVLDGRTGKPRYTLSAPDPIPGGQFGWSMAMTDHTGDGRPDLYVGSAPHHLSGSDQRGGTWVFRGHDGALLESLALPDEWDQPASDANLGPNLGWSIAAPGDLDGDGIPDYVAGAPFTDVGGNQDQGVVFVFLSGG